MAGPGPAGRVGIGRLAAVVAHDRTGPLGCLAYELSDHGGRPAPARPTSVA